MTMGSNLKVISVDTSAERHSTFFCNYFDGSSMRHHLQIPATQRKDACDNAMHRSGKQHDAVRTIDTIDTAMVITESIAVATTTDV